MNTTFADGYNILPTPAVPTTPEPPAAPPKPRTWGLFFCGIQWAVISGIVLAFAGGTQGPVFPWAAGALVLSLALAAVGLVWGIFQHVLKTIVRIVRHGN